MLYKAEVKVSLKPGVLDPQGVAVAGAVKTLGYTGVPQVRIGKLVEVWVEAETEAEASAKVQEIGSRILANPVMETFSFTIAPSTDKLAPLGDFPSGAKIAMSSENSPRGVY